MKGKYVKPNGEPVIVHDFDEVNKIVSVDIGANRFKHYGENEYKDWVGENGGSDIEYTFGEIIRLPVKDKVLKVKQSKKK